MDILDDMGVSKLSAKVFLKVSYSFKNQLSSTFRRKNGGTKLRTELNLLQTFVFSNFSLFSNFDTYV